MSVKSIDSDTFTDMADYIDESDLASTIIPVNTTSARPHPQFYAPDNGVVFQVR